jgi:hypothetical protein
MDAFARLAAMSALLGTAATIQAEQISRTIYVDASAPDGGDGKSWNTAYRDFASACAQTTQLTEDFGPVGSGIVIDIRLAQGTYRPSPDRAAALSAFEIGTKVSTPVSAVALVSGLNLTILGGLAGRSSADPDRGGFVSVVTADINGNDQPEFKNRDDNAQTVLTIMSKGPSNVIIGGVTFTGANVRSRPGAVELVGGGLHVAGSHLSASVRDCTFVENQGAQGGGAKCDNGYFEHGQFTKNRADEGGGAYGVRTYLSRCKFTSNQAGRGGGAVLDGGTAYCEFRNNIAVSDGGAIARSENTVFAFSYVYGSLFAGNISGRQGGAVHSMLKAGSEWFHRCTFVENRALQGGGVAGPQLRLVGCILWGNRASIAGDEIYVSAQEAELTSALIEDTPHSIAFAFGASITKSRVISANPRFVDQIGSDGDATKVLDNNYRLDADSPAIDRMTGAFYGGYDLDGFLFTEAGPGSINRVPDLGCYEWRQTCPADFDNSGGTPDTGDLAAFFEAFSAGDAAADVNKSGGTPDSDDIEAFFNVWLAGGC